MKRIKRKATLLSSLIFLNPLFATALNGDAHININPYYEYDQAMTKEFFNKRITKRNRDFIHQRSFMALDEEYYSLDRYHVYYTKSHQRKNVVENADPFSFRTIDSVGAYRKSHFGNGYSRDDERVFHGGDEIVGADPDTFEVLGRNYDAKGTFYFAVDKNHVYRGPYRIVGADPKTFNPISESFSVDAEHIFIGRSLIEGSDSATFTQIDEGYSKDKNQVYFTKRLGDYERGKFSRVKNADPATFEPLKLSFDERNNEGYRIYHFARDKDHLYSAGKEIEGFDPDTFEVISQHFIRDKVHLYGLYPRYQLNIRRENGVDVQTFEALAVDFLFKDRNNLYHRSSSELNLIEGADPQSFTFLIAENSKANSVNDYSSYIYASDSKNLYWMDSYHYYSMRLPEDLDWMSLAMINEYYFRDKEYVYYDCNCVNDDGDLVNSLQLVEGADPETFEARGYYAQDRYGKYNKGVRL